MSPSEPASCPHKSTCVDPTNPCFSFFAFFLSVQKNADTYLVAKMKVPPPPKLTAKAPENGWLEDYILSYWVSAYFQGRAISFREGKPFQPGELCLNFTSSCRPAAEATPVPCASGWTDNKPQCPQFLEKWGGLGGSSQVS